MNQTMRCDYVYLNLLGKPFSRAKLLKRVQRALAGGRFVHWVDPCTLTEGHPGPHVLTTMPRPQR